MTSPISQAPFSQLTGAPRIAFLGLSEKAAFVREGHPIAWRHNIIGLGNAVLNWVYPAGLEGWHIVFACFDPTSIGPVRLRLVDEKGGQLLRIDLQIAVASMSSVEAQTPVEKRHWRPTLHTDAQWILFSHSLEKLVIARPGTVRVLFGHAAGDEEVEIGSFEAVALEALPLTPDRVAAIRADPKAARLVRVVIGCKNCPGSLAVIAAIDRPNDLDGVTNVWYEDAPDEWTCGCKATVIDLTSIKRNLHGALGMPVTGTARESRLGFVRMYERGTLLDLGADFAAVLEGRSREEDLQVFLENNPLLLHRFSATRIRAKAPILTQYCTDFAILDSRGILLLVEIEPAGTKLLKRNGDVAQALQHSFDQVRAWLDTTRRHWSAVLECIGFPSAEVAGVRGVVIAGRDKPYQLPDLMRLKGADNGQVDFYTFDDLLEDVLNLTRQFR